MKRRERERERENKRDTEKGRIGALDEISL